MENALVKIYAKIKALGFRKSGVKNEADKKRRYEFFKSNDAKNSTVVMVKIEMDENGEAVKISCHIIEDV